MRVLRWIFVGFYSLLAMSAHANTIRGDVQQCLYLANSIAMVMEVKAMRPDMTWETAKAELTPLINSAVGDPTSFIGDKEDAALVLRVYGLVWQGKATIEEVFNACQRAPASRRG